MDAEDHNWNCSDEHQQSLVDLHGKDKEYWHTAVVTTVQAHPSKFDILEVVKTEDNDYLYSFNEFAAHFKDKEGSIKDDQLLRLMFDDMEKYDEKHVKLQSIGQWFSTAHVPVLSESVDAADSEMTTAMRSKIEALEQENADLDSKLNAKTQELEVVKSEKESVQARFEEMESKYKALLEVECRESVVVVMIPVRFTIILCPSLCGSGTGRR